jgi:hypothetical protein
MVFVQKVVSPIFSGVPTSTQLLSNIVFCNFADWGGFIKPLALLFQVKIDHIWDTVA